MPTAGGIDVLPLMISGPRFSLPGLGLWLAGWLMLAQPRSAQAEGLLSYKYQDYRESGGRIVVKTQAAVAEQDLGTATRLKVQGIIDAIAGATPNGQPAPAGSDQVVLTKLTERRKAWNADLSHQFSRTRISVGGANSRESDYVSTGVSLNTQTGFNQKNTTLLAGIAGTEDRVKVFYQTAWADKRTMDVILGVTQLLDPRTSVTLNLTWGESEGYLNDQYKLVQKNVQLAPGFSLPFTYSENRPDQRTRVIALAAWNQTFPKLGGTVDASYRYFRDSFDTTAHTVELHWLQRLGEHVILQPELRLYQQTAAEFYHYRLDGTNITPVAGAPRPQGPFYSSDYRLSEMATLFYGAKLIWTPSERWQFDAAVEQYEMRGRDGVTPQSAYPNAAIVTVGGRFSW